MAMGVRASTLAILSMAVSSFGLAGCGLKAPPPFDPITAQSGEKAASADAKNGAMPPLPTTLEDLSTQPSEPGAAAADPQNPPASRNVHVRAPAAATVGRLRDDMTIRVPFQEIVHRAVLHCAEVKVAGYDPAIAKTRILEAEARFDPTAFVNLKYEHQDTPFAGQAIQNPVNPTATEILNVERGEVYTMEPGIKQLLPSGGEASVSYQFQYNYLTPQRFVLNPYWDNQLKFQLTQPIFRNAGFDVNQARITIARNDAHVATLDYRKTLEENIAELEKDYWQLQEAEREVLIQENLLRITRDTADILFKQRQQGQAGVSRVQTSQAQASIESRGAVLIRARARLRDISDDMKKRMNDPDFPVAGPAVILPLDTPSEQRIRFLVADQVSTAVANRFELGQQQLRINDADVAMNVARNNLLPKLDLTAAITLEGLGKDESKAFHQWNSDGHIGYSLGFTLEMPIGNREARAIYRRAQLQRLQAMEQYRALIAQITLDVTTAIREVETTWNEIGARRQARFAQSDQLGALEDRRTVGAEALTPTFVQLVLDAQERLADAEREEALAVASYQVSIARLERAKGTLLRYNNVLLAEDKFRGMER